MLGIQGYFKFGIYESEKKARGRTGLVEGRHGDRGVLLNNNKPYDRPDGRDCDERPRVLHRATQADQA